MFKKGKKFSAGTIGNVSCLLIFLPVALAFLYVYSFGVNVVARDSWAVIPLFGKLYSGTLGVSDLFAQHAEHRILFPRIAMLSLGVLTDYNSVAEMYFTLACFLLTLIGLLLVFRNDVKAPLSLLLFVPVAFMVFSLRQHENMLSGFQVAFGLVQAFSVLAFCLLYFSRYERLRKFAFPAALGSGTVATFSAAQGLFVWPVGFLQLLISPIEKPAKKWLIGAWSLVGVGEVVIYFIGYETPSLTSSPYYVLENPVTGMGLFLSLLGSSLFGAFEPASFAVVSGLLMVGLTLVSLLSIYKDRKLGENSLWIALLLFSLPVLASIAVGRAESWNPDALAGRYTTFSILSLIAIYAILIKQTFEKRSYPVTLSLGVVSVLVLSSTLLSYPGGVAVGRKMEVDRERAAFTLLTYKSQPDELLAEIHERPNVKERRAPALERLGLNVFSDPRQVLPPPLSELSSVPSSTLSEVESISGFRVNQEDQSIQISANDPFLRVSGWAVDGEAEDAAGGVYIDIDGKLFPAFYGADRRDLADRFGTASYRYAGFERFIPVSEIGTGTHELSLVVLTNDKEGYYRSAQEVAFEIR